MKIGESVLQLLAVGLFIGAFIGVASGQTPPGPGTCATLASCAYQEVTGRAEENRKSFYVYRDADSAFNHGFASGLFFSKSISPSTITIDAGCLDSVGAATGCATDHSLIDQTRGTVFRISFPALGINDYVGLNFQDPENYTPGDASSGYNIAPAGTVQFDIRSPSGANVQFGIGGCVTGFYSIGPQWQTISIPLNTLYPPPGGSFYPCPPDTTNTHILFTVTTNGARQPAASTVLLDNVQFTPVPARQNAQRGQAALSLPISTRTFGVVPVSANPVPPDQANRNIAAIYESALAILTLLKRGTADDIANALGIADALDYALNHENHGDPLPQGSGGSKGLHNAYMAGDIALLNTQSPQGAQAGDARLAGFSGGALCGSGKFCLVLDGATGGNNAWAILALVAAYFQSGREYYLADAETIGSWMIDQLRDPSPNGLSGYFVGFNDSGPGGLQQPIKGKSTENNADIFGAFNLLTLVKSAKGNLAASQYWSDAAKAAGDFVERMRIPGGGFYVGTVHANDKGVPGSGNCTTANSPQFGDDVVNTCEFIDSDTFAILPMAGAVAYSSAEWRTEWVNALQHVLTYSTAGKSYTQSVTVGSNTYQGFHLVPAALATGIAFEFTGQVAVSCSFLDSLLSLTTFQACENSYPAHMAAAQASAPFANGKGLVASVLPNGDTLPAANQCLPTPFQCIPERLGLASTTWAILTGEKFNPMAFSGGLFSPSELDFGTQTAGATSSATVVTLTNAGTLPMVISQLAIVGANLSDFAKTDTCLQASPLAVGAACTVTLKFHPMSAGIKTATLVVMTNGFSGSVSLAGSADPVNDFSLSVSPANRTVNAGGSVSFAVQTAITGGGAQTITLSVGGLPSGVTASFAANSISAGTSTQLTLSTALLTVAGHYEFTISASSSEISHTATAEITVSAAFTTVPSALVFGAQNIGTESVGQTVTVTNPGPQPLTIVLFFTGMNSGEFKESDNCPFDLPPLASCTVSVTFAPVGTGPRVAVLRIASTVAYSHSIPLNGVGAGTCQTISNCAFAALSKRVSAAASSFFVYKDADDSLNHGIPSGVFTSGGLNPSVVTIDAGCVDLLDSPTGCAVDPTILDVTRGTVLSVTFPSMAFPQFAGLNIQEPTDYLVSVPSTGYNLAPATTIRFEARAPLGAHVRFGVGGCVAAPYFSLGTLWQTFEVPLNSLRQPNALGTSCTPNLSALHILFAISADSVMGSGLAPVTNRSILLDNIEFLPVPSNQATTVSLPLSTMTYGVKPQPNYPIPTDQVNRNLATVYESSLTMAALLARGQAQDLSDALRIAAALDYALHHDNHGDPIPSVNGVAGLHSGYEAGDLPFLNPQSPSVGGGQAGDIRLSGFSASASLCGATQFCLVLDGATGGNNAWAILALAAAFERTGNAVYLTDAEAIGDWIASLEDQSGAGLGGYYLGYSDGGLPKQLLIGKSTEQNAVIFAAFNRLSQIESLMGNSAAAALWAARAKKAADFVIQMFDPNGRFNAGTLNNIFTTSPGPGVCPSTTQIVGPDTVNTCDSLNSNTIPILAMSGSAAYRNAINWSLPAQYLSTFLRTVSAAGHSYQGFEPVHSSSGISWEFTAQAGAVYQTPLLANGLTLASMYLQQISAAQNSAPFGDGFGVVAATLEDGEAVPPASQCLSTPFQCIPERPGLAATSWAALADRQANPLSLSMISVATSAASVNFGPQSVGVGASQTVTLTNTWSVAVTLTISIAGANSSDFSRTGCPAVLSAGASCTLSITFTPATSGPRNASLSIVQTPAWAQIGTASGIALSGNVTSQRRGQVTSQ